MSLTITEVPRRRAPWIGIGVSGEWQDYREALHAAELDFDVRSLPAQVEIPDPILSETMGVALTRYEEVPGVKVNVRKTDDQILGCVSSQYGVIQNDDAFRLLQPLCHAGAVITHAGMTEQGLVFMVAEWHNFYVGGEEYDLNIMCTNSFNGNFPCGLILTPTRIICQNMYRKVVKDQLISVRHMSLAPRRIEEAIAQQEMLLSFEEKFKGVMESSLSIQLAQSDVDKLVAMIFPYPKDKESMRYETSVQQINMLREEFLDTYYCASDVKKFGACAMRFLHAYYDYLSHGNLVRRETLGNVDSKRLSRLVSGESVNGNIVNMLVQKKF